jgi:cellulose synthase/poly-beta-1,6-N-acetylglucosamine synthase-like glycosyltransferase
LENEKEVSSKTVSILIALYKEYEIIGQLFESLDKICFDKSKLDIKIITECDDFKTKEAIFGYAKKFNLSFDLIDVPYFEPRTKPKALNYASLFCTGDVFCIYDAEDVPDPLQIKKVLSFFNQNKDVDCVQCSLNFYNYDTNYLTRCFNFEYFNWFFIILKGYSVSNVNFPLGGTSNYITKNCLFRCGFWNSFNVTEDLELSIVMAKKHYKIKKIDSITQEGCVVNIPSWIKQRKRWMKGYFITYLENFTSFNPVKNFKNFFFLHVTVGLSTLGFIIAPLILILKPKFHFQESILFYSLFCFNYFIIPTFSCLFFLRRCSVFNIVTLSVAYFFYFFLHIFTVYIAIYESFKMPFFWNKTSHVVLKNKNKDCFLLNFKKTNY